MYAHDATKHPLSPRYHEKWIRTIPLSGLGSIIYYQDSVKCGFPTNIEREKIYSTLAIDCCIENNENARGSHLAKASTIIKCWSV